MLETKRVIKPTPTTLESLLGDDAKIMSSESLLTNKFIQVDFIKTCFCNTENISEESSGRLWVYPIADNTYHVHLVIIPPDQDSCESEVYWFQFRPEFFDMFESSVLASNIPFRFDKSNEQQFSVCGPSKLLLEQLKNPQAINELTEAFHLTEIAIQLLTKAIENIALPFTVCAVPACRFLANQSEREKVIEARSIIDQTIDQPLTIKELSRKVAMNECYLKKGFKTLFGKTINEYQQHLRITKAKELLQIKNQTVSEVASQLGYSSISHFSTAFKKATGLKPCELLG